MDQDLLELIGQEASMPLQEQRDRARDLGRRHRGATQADVPSI
jgi:hypothetical protein